MHTVQADTITTKPILVYTDGACAGNPGPGGWGVIIVFQKAKRVIELGGYSSESTNNKMELTAVGKALRYLEDKQGELTIFTDSKYVIDGATKWVKGWKEKGWKKSDGKEVLNIEFWKRLMELVEARKDPIKWVHVKGHAGVPGNERCDEIAVSFSQKKSIQLYDGPLESYKNL